MVEPRPVSTVRPIDGLGGHIFVVKSSSSGSYIEFPVDGDFRAGGRHHVPVRVLARHGGGGGKTIMPVDIGDMGETWEQT